MGIDRNRLRALVKDQDLDGISDLIDEAVVEGQVAARHDERLELLKSTMYYEPPGWNRFGDEVVCTRWNEDVRSFFKTMMASKDRLMSDSAERVLEVAASLADRIEAIRRKRESEHDATRHAIAEQVDVANSAARSGALDLITSMIGDFTRADRPPNIGSEFVEFLRVWKGRVQGCTWIPRTDVPG